MGWDIYVVNKKSLETVAINKPHYIRGSIYAVDGSTSLSMALTYNYSKHYYKIWPENGLEDLNGLPIGEAVPKLLEAILALSGADPEATDDYWKPTKSNARDGLVSILNLCLLSEDMQNILRIA